MELEPKALGVILDSEVPAKARRRRFTVEYKLRILREADGCKGSGAVGALLRREGLYSSHLVAWRRERERGALQGLGSRKRGRKTRPESVLEKQVAELERENQRLRKRLEQAETIIEVQKKVSRLLGIPPESDGDGASS
jgi:transposase-like protein